jgi:hypothetical protein
MQVDVATHFEIASAVPSGGSFSSSSSTLHVSWNSLFDIPCSREALVSKGLLRGALISAPQGSDGANYEIWYHVLRVGNGMGRMYLRRCMSCSQARGEDTREHLGFRV